MHVQARSGSRQKRAVSGDRQLLRQIIRVFGNRLSRKFHGSFSIDHHTGSEEQQPGEEYFDPDLLDQETGRIDTFKHFRKTIFDFNLDDTVIPVVGRSAPIGRIWKTPLSLLFIDGSHAYESVLSDYEIWAKNLIPGGYLLFHDIFPDPSKGGQAPYRVTGKPLHLVYTKKGPCANPWEFSFVNKIFTSWNISF